MVSESLWNITVDTIVHACNLQVICKNKTKKRYSRIISFTQRKTVCSNILFPSIFSITNFPISLRGPFLLFPPSFSLYVCFCAGFHRFYFQCRVQSLFSCKKVSGCFPDKLKKKSGTLRKILDSFDGIQKD